MFSTSLYPLVLEAIRNGDFSFRLPTKGVLPGERAARETINHMMEPNALSPKGKRMQVLFPLQ